MNGGQNSKKSEAVDCLARILRGHWSRVLPHSLVIILGNENVQKELIYHFFFSSAEDNIETGRNADIRLAARDLFSADAKGRHGDMEVVECLMYCRCA